MPENDTRYELRLPQSLLDDIDRVKHPDVPRAAWIRRALEAAVKKEKGS